jgi:hypothetical protein
MALAAHATHPTEGPAVLRRRRHRASAQTDFLDLGDGKSPERRRADARRAHYEHQRRLLEVKDVTQLMASIQDEKPAT